METDGATMFGFACGQKQSLIDSLILPYNLLKSLLAQHSGNIHPKILSPIKLKNGMPMQTRTEPATLLNGCLKLKFSSLLVSGSVVGNEVVASGESKKRKKWIVN